MTTSSSTLLLFWNSPTVMLVIAPLLWPFLSIILTIKTFLACKSTCLLGCVLIQSPSSASASIPPLQYERIGCIPSMMLNVSFMLPVLLWTIITLHSLWQIWNGGLSFAQVLNDALLLLLLHRFEPPIECISSTSHYWNGKVCSFPEPFPSFGSQKRHKFFKGRKVCLNSGWC